MLSFIFSFVLNIQIYPKNIVLGVSTLLRVTISLLWQWQCSGHGQPEPNSSTKNHFGAKEVCNKYEQGTNTIDIRGGEGGANSAGGTKCKWVEIIQGVPKKMPF